MYAKFRKLRETGHVYFYGKECLTNRAYGMKEQTSLDYGALDEKLRSVSKH